MMLFKLSFKNIKKSMKDYAIYFFTLILGVAIFYIFNAIDSQTAMLQVSKTTMDIIDLMNQMLSGVSVFVSFILGFLIIYASQFLIKRRKKEFGIYMTLGMSKGKISKILLFETILIGIISLLVGLGLGVILSQGMSIFVANMFEADMSKFEFIFSQSAMMKTILYFAIMYLLVMIFNTFSIGKCKLIDLLNAKKKTENIKMKNPYVCIIVFIGAVLLLSYAYYNVTSGVANLAEFSDVLKQMAFGAISTFLIFWSLSGLILKLVMSMKKTYFHQLNSFTLRQVNSKVNTTVFSMTVICLMLFLTICILSSALSMNHSMTANLQQLAPVDLYIKKKKVEQEEYTAYEKDYLQKSILENLVDYGFNPQQYLKDTLNFTTYRLDDLTFKTSLGDALEEIQKEYKFLAANTKESIIKLSDYNKVAALYNNPTFNLKDNEYIIIADFESMKELRDRSLKSGAKITIHGKTYYPKYDECQPGFLEISSNHVNSGIFIVPDHAIEETDKYEEILIANYQANDNPGKKEIENLLIEVKSPDGKEHPTDINASSKLAIYEASVGLGATVTFIGLYLGIIFMISSAAILALKELSESTDNKERYLVLRKLGTDEKMINRALFRQIAIFFAFPLILAIIHSIFGIQVCNFILETFGNKNLLISIVMTAGFIIFIYGGYFLITYFVSKNIIKDN